MLQCKAWFVDRIGMSKTWMPLTIQPIFIQCSLASIVWPAKKAWQGAESRKQMQTTAASADSGYAQWGVRSLTNYICLISDGFSSIAAWILRF